MVRVVLLLALLGCRGTEDLERAARMLVVPEGGREVRAQAQPERVATAMCYEGRQASAVAEPLRAGLETVGWEGVVVEPHPALAGRWSVRGAAPGLGLAGVIEEAGVDCEGARLSLGAQVLPEGANRRTAGAPRARLPAN